MNYYLIVHKDIKKVIIEYCNSIIKKIQNSKLIDYPSEEFNNFNFEDYSNNKFIFFGIHYVSYPKVNLNNIYYVNFEQLTINGKNSGHDMLTKVIFFSNLFQNYKLLDYSVGNISILKEHNIKSVCLPYQVNHDEIFDYEKIYNFAICCTWNSRVANIYHLIANKYGNSHSIGNPIMWGQERDNILFRTKVLANVHYREKDYNILEEIRITRCILNKIIVVSEYSLEYDKYPLSKYVLFTEYENMVNKIQDVLDNYEEYYKKIYENFDIVSIEQELGSYITEFTKNNTCENNLFNWEIYINNYKDLRDAGINTQEKAWRHWVMWGHNEGRIYDKNINVMDDTYLSKSSLIEYFIINNSKYVSEEVCYKSLYYIKHNYNNHFDVDPFFYSKINNLSFANTEDTLVHIYNYGVINGLIYHPKQLLNIFPEVKIKDSNNKICIFNNEILEDASEFVKRELYDMDFDWYISQIEIKENSLVDENLLLIVFVGNENVADSLIDKIITYKNIQSFAIGVCFRNENLYNKIKEKIISNFANHALFISKEYGNDIIPSLMMYNKIGNLIKFDKIIKLHTKTSDKEWFNNITEFLLNKSITELDKYKKNICNCVGPDEYYTSIKRLDCVDIINMYSNYMDKQYFIRGTMFYCDRIVIDKILNLISRNHKMFFNNNLYDTNIINFSYSPIHGLERFFGIIKI